MNNSLAKIFDNGEKDVVKLTSSISKTFSNKIDPGQMAGLVKALITRDGWDGELIGQVLRPLVTTGQFDWTAVWNLLDDPSDKAFKSWKDPSGLLRLVKFFAGIGLTESSSTPSVSIPAKTFFSKRWNNLAIQINLVKYCSETPPEEPHLSVLGLGKVIDAVEVNNFISEGLATVVDQLTMHPLNCQDVIEMSLDAVCREDPSLTDAKQFLDLQAKLVPELFFLGGIRMAKPWPLLLERVIGNFFELFFTGHSSSELIFKELARVNRPFLIGMLIEIFERNPLVVGRILVIIQGANILEDALYIRHFNFTLELACLADKEKLYSVRKYLVTSLQYHGVEFVRAALEFLEAKSTMEYSQAQSQAQGNAANSVTVSLSLKTASALLSWLTSTEIPPDRIEQLKMVQIQCLQSYPRLINFGQGYDDVILARNELSNTFPVEVEREMKLYYQKMYEQQIEIRDIITMLQKLRASNDPHDQDVFACMIHSLFDEYRFFPEYPLNALATTAVLFGSLIYFHLIEGMALSIALRFILESVKQPVDSNMFRFGLQALYEFRQRLSEFPKYCTVLLEIPGLKSHQQFYEQIKSSANGELVNAASGQPLSGHGPIGPRDQLSGAPSQEIMTFRSLNADVAVDESTAQEEPSENISDKVLFIVNNLAQNNLVPKSKELSGLLDSSYHQWFASYIVGQRVKQEPNYHSLYISMLENLGSKGSLENYILKVTYTEIIQLFNSTDTINSSEKRTQLKNLGQWLGSLLLARNKPILHKNISFKHLLMEGYDLTRLPVVLPFVCKTLEKAASSSVFEPPNPWLMDIIKVLSELYRFADLKLNLKFEIEVLCNQLNLDITNIEPSTIIRNRTVDDYQEHSNQLTGHLARLQLGDSTLASSGVTSASVTPGSAVSGLQNAGVAAVGQQVSPGQHGSGLLRNLVLTGMTGFVTHRGLKRIFYLAIDKSVREVLQPVVERSVTIASIATRELVLKDFALEPDENKLRIAAHNMIRVLAGNISLATCKDPLRESLISGLRTLMVNNGYSDHELLQEQILIAVNDNLNAIVQIIENATVEKAFGEIEQVMTSAYMLRRRHRENKTSQAFVDPQLSSRYPLQLPDPFRLKPGGLTAQQMSIYEGLGKFTTADLHEEAVLSSSQLGATPVSSSYSEALPDDRPQNTQATFESLILQVQGLMDALEAALRDEGDKVESFVQLPSDDKIQVIISQLLQLLSRNVFSFKEQLILKSSQMTVSLLFTLTQTQLSRETLCFLLDKLCEMSSATSKEVLLWLLYSDDERKYNVPVMLTLIRSRLIMAVELDVNLAKQIVARNEATITFACDLIRDGVLNATTRCCLRSQFIGCIQAFEDLIAERPNDMVVKLLSSLDEAGNEQIGSAKEQFGLIFVEWINLYSHPCATDKTLHLFVYQLSQSGILGDKNLVLSFIRTCVEVALESFSRCVGGLQQFVYTTDVFLSIDALAKLITILWQTNNGAIKAQVDFARNLLSVLLLLFAAAHGEDEGEDDSETSKFNSRPFFRLFSTILYELSQLEDGELKNELYLLIGNVLHSIQPFAFPGFCFSWITLISHRLFMQKLLSLPDKKGWSIMAELLGALVKFEGNYIKGKVFPESIAIMYKGTLRIFLVILHDYPAFLIDYHYKLCNDIPLSFIQLRNLVLSAFPDNMRLPDPLSQGLKVDRLPEIKESPVVAIDPSADLQRLGLKKTIDGYLRVAVDGKGIESKTGADFIRSIMSALSLPEPKRENGLGFDEINVNYAASNALILYVGMQAVVDDRTKLPSTDEENSSSSAHFNRDSPHLALIAQLLVALTTEGRYFICEAIANQLRYPNRHTHFFSCVLLSLFGNYGTLVLGQEKRAIQHLITRVLLERIICNRPHPWGLMITFTELLKNSNYKFWELPFTKSTPEVSNSLTRDDLIKTNQIERMFASLYSHIISSSSNQAAEIAA